MAFQGALLLGLSVLSDEAAAVSLRSSNAAQRQASDRMDHVLEQLGEFKDYAIKSQKEVDNRHSAEEMRLKTALTSVKDAGVRLALEQSLTGNEEALLETQKIYDNMVEFGDNLKGVVQHADMVGFGCETVSCGLHSSCSETVDGPQCICNEGYVGTSGTCHAPPDFRPHPLVFGSASGGSTVAKDLHVCVFEQNVIAAVYRDGNQADSGWVVVGSVHETGQTDISPPEMFTGMHQKAYAPVVQGSPDKRIMIVWRDETTSAAGWVRGAAMGVTGIRGADMSLTWGTAVSFAKEQAHKMAMVSFPGSLFAVMYSDKTIATAHSEAKPFGNSMMATVDGTGNFAKLGEYRFSDFSTCRLEVTKVSPHAFILAARASPTVDEMDPSIISNQEAVAIYGEAVDADLVFDPNPVNLEPKGTQIWARGVSLIAPHTFAYAYQDGSNNDMKMSVVHINPKSHHMTIAGAPVVVRGGFSPYIGMLNVPYTPKDPHTLMIYESGNSSMVNVCSWNEKRTKLENCEDFTWMSSRLTSVSGVHLGDGKSFMVFATESGKPYYSVFGLSKK